MEAAATAHHLLLPRKSFSKLSQVLLTLGVILLLRSAATALSLSELKEALAQGKPVCYLALGDSITYGYGLEEPKRDSFARLFSQMIRRAFRNPNLRFVNAGVSGEKVSDGLQRLPALLKKYHPDIMTVQFGGNDFREKTSLDEFKADLTAIVDEARKECGTFVILIAPPMANDAPQFDAWVVQIMREVALAKSLPIVDADTLLKKLPHDYRGLFPFEAHPTEYSHRQLARLLWETFATWIGFEAHVDTTIMPLVALLDGNSELQLSVRLKNLLPIAQQFELALEIGGTVHTIKSSLAPQEEQIVRVPLTLSTIIEGARTGRTNLAAGVWTESGYSCDLKTLSLAPVVAVAAGGATDKNTQELDITRPTVGSYSWDGPDDLSASFALQRKGEFLQCDVHVRDDKLSPAKPTVPYDGDSVEMYLDLRQPIDQGKPFFTKETIILYVIPGEDDNAEATLLSSEPAPRRFEGMEAVWSRRADGYEVEFRLPITWFSRYSPDLSSSFGFDLAVNDSDEWLGRETQLVWSGSDLDYLNPGVFGALSFLPGITPRTVRAVVQ